MKKRFSHFHILFQLTIIFYLLLIGAGHAEEGFRVEKATKEVVLRGYTRSIKRAVISAEVGGRVVQVNYEVGDVLSKTPFARLDSVFVDFDIQSTRLAISQLGIQIKQIDSRIAYLEKDDHRKERLFVKGRTTEVIRDAASQALDQAMLDRKRLMAQQQALVVTLKRQQEEKFRYTISGPEGWIVTDRRVEQGEVIQAGSPLAVIQNFREMVVPLAVSNDELEGIREAMTGEPDQGKATLTLWVEKERVKASIYYINPEFDEKSRKIGIQLLIHGFSGVHRGGLGCEIPLTVRSKGVKIPSKAVQDRYENPRVFVKGSDTPVSVTILDRSEPWVMVAEDPRLTPGTMLSDTF